MFEKVNPIFSSTFLQFRAFVLVSKRVEKTLSLKCVVVKKNNSRTASSDICGYDLCAAELHFMKISLAAESFRRAQNCFCNISVTPPMVADRGFCTNAGF